MITVLVSLPIRPDHRDRFVADIVPLIIDSPKPEGNLSVQCFESIEAGSFLLVEQWDSQEAMDAWLRSERFQLATEAYQDFLAGPAAAAQLVGP
jgi:quinol monooxygenase YgiN